MLNRKVFLKQVSIVSVTVTLSLSLVCPAIIVAAGTDTPNSNDNGNVNVQENVSSRTKQELLEKWHKYVRLDIDSSKMFEVMPKISAPYSAGKLQQNVLLDGLNATNFARYLAGLPMILHLITRLKRNNKQVQS